MNNQMLIKLRTKKMAILLLDARQAARRTAEECAGNLGIPLEQYLAYESGIQAPTLPEIEALAYFLNIPVNHFWGKEALSQKKEGEALPNQETVKKLRNRMISARVGLERSQNNLTNQDLAEKTSLDPSILEKYEKEGNGIPLPELEVISQALNIPIEDLFDQKGPAGKKRIEQEMLNRFKELPEELQHFVCQPVNRPFLELALHLQTLPVNKLRSVAESLLEITY